MVNRLYNKQVTPKGYKMGGRVKKMGGGIMKRKPLKGGSKPVFLDLDKDKKSPFMGGGIAYAGGGRAMKRKGGKV